MKKGMLKRLIAIVLTMALIAVLPLTESGVTIFADTVAAPTITQQPVSLYAEPGTTAKFTITATDTAPLTYQWQSRKNESSNWANSAQSGAKTKTLSVATTAGLHGWQFRCIVKDGNLARGLLLIVIVVSVLGLIARIMIGIIRNKTGN